MQSLHLVKFNEGDSKIFKLKMQEILNFEFFFWSLKISIKWIKVFGRKISWVTIHTLGQHNTIYYTISSEDVKSAMGLYWTQVPKVLSTSLFSCVPVARSISLRRTWIMPKHKFCVLLLCMLKNCVSYCACFGCENRH